MVSKFGKCCCKHTHTHTCSATRCVSVETPSPQKGRRKRLKSGFLHWKEVSVESSGVLVQRSGDHRHGGVP